MSRPVGIKNSRPKRKPTKIVLTDRFVRTVKPSGERQTIYDLNRRKETTGLALRVEPAGATSWKFLYSYGGRPRWYTIGKASKLSLKDARDMAKKLNSQVHRDEDPQGQKQIKRQQGTFKEMVEGYLEFAQKNRKSWEYYERHLKNFALPVFGGRLIAGITRRDIVQVFEKRKAESVASAKLLLASISAVFEWAKADQGGGLINLENPCHRAVSLSFDKSLREESRTRILSDLEVLKFWKAFDKLGVVIGTALKVLFALGQRPREVCLMRWQDLEIGVFKFDRAKVEADGGVDTIQAKHAGAWWNLPGKEDGRWLGTKNSHDHRVWITSDVLALLDEQDDGNRKGPVFKTERGTPLSRNTMELAMRQICQDLGITPKNSKVWIKSRVEELIKEDPKLTPQEASDKAADEIKKAKVVPHDLRRSHGSTITSLGFSKETMNRIQNHLEGGIASVYDRFSYQDEARHVQVAVWNRLMQLVKGKGARIVELEKREKAG